VQVNLEPGTYRCEWFDPTLGQAFRPETRNITQNAAAFSCPVDGDAVLFLERVVFPGRAWQRATPESQGLDAGRLESAVAYLRENAGPDGVGELAIVRNGYMVWHGPHIDKVHGIWSCTKSFTSTVLGLLIEDGKATPDTRAKEHLAELATAYPGVTLRHFTTMTSGYRAENDEPRGGYRHGPSPTPFDPCNTPLFAPGTHYAYWDSAMNQFGNVLTHIAGEPMIELFHRRIAEPIGMDPDKWDWGDFGQIDGIVVNGGSGNSNNHVFICAREMARFGHLFLNRGNWDGRRLISADWVDLATKPHVCSSLPLWPDSGADGRGVYGFNWWTNATKADGQPKWPGAPAGTYAACGYNNNDMFVIPEWNMVIVRLGLDQQQRKVTDAVYGQFIRRVGLARADMPVFDTH
jgi:CubicO group peptidase (beta-lactamase class C family)